MRKEFKIVQSSKSHKIVKKNTHHNFVFWPSNSPKPIDSWFTTRQVANPHASVARTRNFDIFAWKTNYNFKHEITDFSGHLSAVETSCDHNIKILSPLTCDHVSKHVHQIRANIVIDFKLFFCPLRDCKSNLSF